MTEYFVVTTSFAAPFFSDEDERFVDADSPEAALEKVAREYKHPAGLYAALCYADANAKAKREKPLAKWLCNHEIEKMRLTADKGAYSYFGHETGHFDIDGKRHVVENPKEGRVVAARH